MNKEILFLHCILIAKASIAVATFEQNKSIIFCSCYGNTHTASNNMHMLNQKKFLKFFIVAFF